MFRTTKIELVKSGPFTLAPHPSYTHSVGYTLSVNEDQIVLKSFGVKCDTFTGPRAMTDAHDALACRLGIC